MTSLVYKTNGEYVTYSEYRQPPTGNLEILKSIREALLLGNDPKVTPLSRDNLHIHIYDPISENEYWVPLSQEFLLLLEDRGLHVICRLGSGAESDAFLVYDDVTGSIRTLLLESNRSKEEISEKESEQYLARDVEKVSDIVSIPGIYSYVNRIYETFYSTTPYSDNKVYLAATVNDFQHRPIYLLEYMSYTLAGLLNINRDRWMDTPSEFETFLDQVRNFDGAFHRFLEQNQLTYKDIHTSNIMIGYGKGFSYFKYVDIQSISRGKKHPDATGEGEIIDLLRDDMQ